jgi:hypothetical protein
MAILFTSHQEISTDAFSEQTKRKTTNSSTTSESPLPIKKSVRFSSSSSLIQEQIISTITDKKSDEWKATNYSKIELNAIIRENQRLLMRHKRNKFDSNDDNRNYSLRGLEALSGKEKKTRNERHSRAVHKVISTQKKFTINICNTTSLDDNKSTTRDTIIAQSYISACEECRDEAIQRGLKDERVVQTTNSILLPENNGSSKKKLSQRKGGIRNIFLRRSRQRSPSSIVPITSS